MHTIPANMTPRNLHPLALLPQPAPLAEAPCSINAHVDINGLRVQVTGRGLTPEDAASNFRQTLAAMQPPPVPTPKTLAAQVAELLACGLGKASAAQDWPLVERLSKAAALVLAGMVELGDRPGMLAVRSMANPDTWYEVEGKLCTCPDAQHHPERVCKHVLAAKIYERILD